MRMQGRLYRSRSCRKALIMTISSSLSAGVAGLNANATRLASISDNIANSGTYGYKRASTDFTSMVITSSRGAGTYSAGGVRASTVRLIDERGDLVGTGNALDLAIAGRGMLPVINEVSLGNAISDTPLLMTRTGSFNSAILSISPSTLAAPHMSYFMVYMPAPSFSHSPPVSKVIPLPT